ncbi:MAG: hypothetical protein MHPSP_002943, partial [Paramarteilia canceri]
AEIKENIKEKDDKDFSFQNLSQNLFKTAGGDDVFVSQEAFDHIKKSQNSQINLVKPHYKASTAKKVKLENNQDNNETINNSKSRLSEKEEEIDIIKIDFKDNLFNCLKNKVKITSSKAMPFYFEVPLIIKTYKILSLEHIMHD